MKKRTFYTELAYLLGLMLLAVGVSFMEKSDFGVSMVVAPAYVLHRAISPTLPFFSFGMAEYTLQAALLVVLIALLRKFRPAFLFSFVTAVFYGFLLDGAMALVGLFAAETVLMRLVCYVVGMLLCSAGVALVFHTYIAPEVYELFVKEMSKKHGIPIHKFKTGYDIVSCLVGVGLSFVFFGFGTFVGVRWGTIVCALLNGSIIGFMSRFLEKRFNFRDKLRFRPFFEGETEKA